MYGRNTGNREPYTRKNNPKKIREMCDSLIPRESISTRPGGGGRSLSYLEGWDVIAFLNDAFEQAYWGYSIQDLKCVADNPNDKKGVKYLCQLEAQFDFGDAIIEFTDVGFGDGDHELAAKEAVTDAIKRCAKNLGWRTGLALYDKTQEHVDNGTTQTSKVTQKVSSNPVQSITKEEQPPSSKAADPSPQAAQGATAPSSTPAYIKAVQSLAAVLVAQKKCTQEELKLHMQRSYGVDRSISLTEPQADEFRTLLTNIQNKQDAEVKSA